MPERRTPGVDWAGVAHARCIAPRIASLVPSLTETLFWLDLGARLVARTGFCIHPRGEVKRVPRIGGTKDPDLAALAALSPTHVLVNVDENRRDDVNAARAIAPHVIVTHPCAPEDNARLLRLLGAIFDRDSQAAALARRADGALAALEEVSSALPRENVLYLIWRKPWMTVARDTYIAATLSRAGFDTLPRFSDRRYPVLADDDPVWDLADRVLLASEPYAFIERDARTLRIARGKRVHLIDGEWTSWYGARAIEGLRALARYRGSL